jgi:hypothetical protein
VVVPSAALPVAAALIGCSAWQLIVRRFAGAEMSSSLLWTLGLPPVIGFALPVGLQLRRLGRSDECGEREANLLFQVVGTTLFAALLPLGLLLAKSEQFTLTLARFAPLASTLAAPLLAAGLLLWRRLNDPALLKERRPAAVRRGRLTAAVAVACWFRRMLPVALVNAAVFTWVAPVAGVAHLPAGFRAAAAYLSAPYVRTTEWNGTDVHAALETSGVSERARRSAFAVIQPSATITATAQAPAGDARGISPSSPRMPQAPGMPRPPVSSPERASLGRRVRLSGSRRPVLCGVSFAVRGRSDCSRRMTGRAGATYAAARLGARKQLPLSVLRTPLDRKCLAGRLLGACLLSLLAAALGATRRRGGREAVGQLLGYCAAVTSTLAVPLVSRDAVCCLACGGVHCVVGRQLARSIC